MNDNRRNSADAQASFAMDVQAVVDDLITMLINKNKKYGDAALNPNQTFSTCSAEELINVRLDDKLSRIRNRQDDEDEDPEWDILGYLVLKRVAKRRKVREEGFASICVDQHTPGR